MLVKIHNTPLSGSAGSAGLLDNKTYILTSNTQKYLLSSYCLETHSTAVLNKKDKVDLLLPQKFQKSLLCAGAVSAEHGSCKGDSGGPLMQYNVRTRQWTLIATVQGQIGDCGNNDFPGIYVRLNHPLVLGFVNSVLNPKPGE